jgi:outer membrane protein TolC
LGASWTLYPGGRNIYQILAAKRRKVSADFLLTQTYQEQLALAAQEYYKLLAAYQQKGVVIRSILDAQEQVKMNQAKVKSGKGIPLDLSRAKTNYAQQQSSLVQSESAILQSEQALLNCLNLDSAIHLVPNEMDALKKQLLPDTVPVAALVAQAIHMSPAIQAGAQELKALGYDYKTVRSDLIPAITLQTYMRGSGTALNNMQRSTSGGISINANLLQNMGLLVPYQMQEKKKLIEQKALSQKALSRDVESKVMTAFLNSENYESAIEAAEQALNSAQDSYELATGRFKAGYGVNLDVLDAQSQMATARGNLVQAVLNYNQAQVQLVQALGMVSPQALTEGIDDLQGRLSNGNKAK